MAERPDGKIVLAGFTYGSWGEANRGGNDFIAVLLEPPTLSSPAPASAPADESYSASPTRPNASAAPSSAPSVFSTWNSPTAPTPTPSAGNPPVTPDNASAAGSSTLDPAAMIAIVSAAGIVMVALGFWVARRRLRQKPITNHQGPSPTDRERKDDPGLGDADDPVQEHQPNWGSRNPMFGHDGKRIPQHHRQQTLFAAAGLAQSSSGLTTLFGKDGDGAAGGEGAEDGAGERSASATSVSTAEQAELAQFHQGPSVTSAAPDADESTPGVSGESGVSATVDRRRSRDGVGFGEAVMQAVLELALHCQIPGVSEAAAMVSILVNLVSDSSDSGSDGRLRQCRSIITMLQRAAKVAERVSLRFAVSPVFFIR